MGLGCLQAYLKGGKLIRLLDKAHPGLLEVKLVHPIGVVRGWVKGREKNEFRSVVEIAVL